MTARMLRRASESIVKRTDDNLESFSKRIVTYNTQTMPIVEIFRANNLLMELDAEKPPSEVVRQFLERNEFIL
jgi:adenylate kinase family enzyme